MRTVLFILKFILMIPAALVLLALAIAALPFTFYLLLIDCIGDSMEIAEIFKRSIY